MESNEQTELTSEIDTGSYIEQADSSGGDTLGVEGSSKKEKKEKELTDTDNSVVIAGAREVGGNGRGYKGVNW